MQRAYLFVIGCLLATEIGWAQAGNPVTVNNEGWTITADAQLGIFSVTYENLGTVLKDVRLNLHGPQGVQQLKGWSVTKVGENGVSIHTTEPRTAWVLKLEPDALTISTTTAEGMLTAEAPATPDRIVARLLDPQGVPGDVGGNRRNQGWLRCQRDAQPVIPSPPQSGGDVLSLGQVSGSNLHSLFDRQTDTAIDFPKGALMRRTGRRCEPARR